MDTAAAQPKKRWIAELEALGLDLQAAAYRAGYEACLAEHCREQLARLDPIDTLDDASRTRHRELHRCGHLSFPTGTAVPVSRATATERARLESGGYRPKPPLNKHWYAPGTWTECTTAEALAELEGRS